MNGHKPWDAVDRRAFLKMTAAAIAGVSGLPLSEKAQAAARNESVDPFTIKVSDAVLNDLRDRLERTRFPDQLVDVGWDQGAELTYIKELCAYWRSEFDWRAQERNLNRLDHFRTEIGGLKIHFVHRRSPENNAFPLIVLHGWPGSFVEFTKVVEPLTDPVAYGGSPEDAFHVICPSLPGYGFSDAPRQPGFGFEQMARTFAELMVRLGYTRYGAQGGD